MRIEWITPRAEEPVILITKYLESFHIAKSYCAYLLSDYDPLSLNLSMLQCSY